MAVKYERRPLAVNTGERTTIQLPPRVFRVRLTGLLFETNKTFLLPGAMEGIRGLVDFYGSHPDMGLVITGHADRVGSAWHNLALSEERAEAMGQFLKDDVEAWMECYRSRPASTPWGLREDQHMLTAVLDGQGQPFYDGPVHSWLDEPTANAIRRFQAAHGLAESGSPDEGTRRALVEAYMSLDDTTLPPAAEVERLGCGENHNAVETADGVDEQANRRVEIFLFDTGKIDPPVPDSCPGAGCAYEHWLEATIETVDFEDALAELLVQVIGRREGEDLQLLPGADVELVRAGFPSRKAKTDPVGQVHFADLTSGTWSVYAEKEDFAADDKQIEVHPGGFVVLGTQDEPQAESDFVGSPGTTNAVATGAVLMNLKDDRYVVRWVDEPSITPAARERAFDWKDDIVHIHPNFPPAAGVTDDDADGLFVLPRGKSTKAQVEEAFKRGPHETSVQWRTEVVGELLPGKVADLRVSSRLRMSAWVFHSAFMKGLVHTSSTDVILDETSLGALVESGIDDLSYVHTIGWIPGSNPPRVGWRDHAPGGDVNRSANYLRQMIDVLHAHGMQLQVGWTVGDFGTTNSPYSLQWTSFLSSASLDDMDTLAASALDFFRSQNLDVDGLGVDFEINSLRLDHGPKIERLFTTTARLFREHKRDAFVTYATAPFTQDGKGHKARMNIQPFGMCTGHPNMFSRPMCFNDSGASDAQDVRDSVECVLRKADDGDGGGVHPSQTQFGLFARKQDAFEDLITNTLRPNRIGLMLYQIPPAHLLMSFLADCPKWNALLNPGEALPRTPGQPLQVPRVVDFGI